MCTLWCLIGDIVDTANFKGPNLSQLFDSTIEVLPIGFDSITGQITLIFIKNLLKNHGLRKIQVWHVFDKFAVSSIKHERVGPGCNGLDKGHSENAFHWAH